MSEQLHQIGDRVELAYLHQGSDLDRYQAEKCLTPGKTYTIGAIIKSNWGETRIELRERKGMSFNILMFRNLGREPGPRFHMYKSENGMLYCTECAGELPAMELMLLEEKVWSPTEFSIFGWTYTRPAWLDDQTCDICGERLWKEVREEDDVA